MENSTLNMLIFGLVSSLILGTITAQLENTSRIDIQSTIDINPTILVNLGGNTTIERANTGPPNLLGSVTLQLQNMKTGTCLQSAGSSDNDPAIFAPCSNSKGWTFSLVYSVDNLGAFSILYFITMVNDPFNSRGRSYLSIQVDPNTQQATPIFSFVAYTPRNGWYWVSTGPKSNIFQLKSAFTNLCLASPASGVMTLASCAGNGDTTFFYIGGRFMDHLNRCIFRQGNTITTVPCSLNLPNIIIAKEIYFAQSTQVPGKCLKSPPAYFADVTTLSCGYDWSMAWVTEEDQFNPAQFLIINTQFEGTAAPDPSNPENNRVVVVGHSGSFPEKWIAAPVPGVCKIVGKPCAGVFGGCCSGLCTGGFCQKNCVLSGATCQSDDTCCGAGQFCSHKSICENRNPAPTCRKAGFDCYSCCGGRMCTGKRKCACSLTRETCADDDDCCDAGDLCTSGICTAQSVHAQCGGLGAIGDACASDTDCCQSGESIKCVSAKCAKVCLFSELEYCTNDAQCCPGKQCSQEQKCTSSPIVGRPTPDQCQLGDVICKTDYDCCDDCQLAFRDGGAHTCTGSVCNVLNSVCLIPGRIDAKGKDCCELDTVCRENICVSCSNQGGSCSSNANCCPLSEPRAFFSCEGGLCAKRYSVPKCLGAGEESPQANGRGCCNGYGSCEVTDCSQIFVEANCYFCNPGWSGSQCKSNGDCRSGVCDGFSFFCVGDA